MNTIENRQYDMLLHVREFGAKYAANFPSDSLGGRLFTSVGETAEALSAFAIAENTHRGDQLEDVSARDAAREKLMETIKTVSRTARAMAAVRPGVERKFRVPYGLGQLPFISAVHAFIEAAEPMSELFAEYELPAGTLDRLRAELAAYESLVGRRNTVTSTRTLTTAGIDEAIGRGMEAVRQLDAIVRNKFEKNQPVLTEWERARTVPRAQRAARPEAAKAAATGA